MISQVTANKVLEEIAHLHLAQMQVSGLGPRNDITFRLAGMKFR